MLPIEPTDGAGDGVEGFKFHHLGFNPIHTWGLNEEG